MFFRKKEKRNIFQERADKRFIEGWEKAKDSAKNAGKGRDPLETIRNMTDFCIQERITEFAEFTDRAWKEEKRAWLRLLLNPAVSYYFRQWIASYKRLTETGNDGILSVVEGGAVDDGGNQGESGALDGV